MVQVGGRRPFAGPALPPQFTAGLIPMMRFSCTRAVSVLLAGMVAVAPAQAGQDPEVELRTVVGCLAGGGGAWMLERATPGEPTERAFTSREELEASRGRALGSLSYRLLGVGEFAVEDHDGHKVQVKGLWFARDGELRLNVTSFQPLDLDCRQAPAP